MKNLKRISLLLCLLLSAYAGTAQRHLLEDADQAFVNKKYFDAADLYKRCLPKISRKDQKARCIYKVAECYRLISDNKAAELWYTKAIAAHYPDPTIHLHRAEALKKEAQYNAAITEYVLYKSLVPASPDAELGLVSAELAQKWKESPTRYVVENMVQLNTNDYDFSPMFWRKKNTLVFTSRRSGATGEPVVDTKTGLLFTDLFTSRVDANGKWESPRPLAAPVNTNANEGSCWINAKGDRMYFTRCEKNKNKIMRCGIWVCSKKGTDSWSTPEPIDFSLEEYSKFDFRHPALTPDGNTMVFQSDIDALSRDSALLEPNTDMYISHLDKKTNKWSSPENLGSDLNTPGKEGFPYIRDDSSLYYASDGMAGMGGLDIFRAEHIPGKAWRWRNPQNLKYPMNSAGDDFGIVFEGVKDKGFLTSNREGGKGKDDIYSFLMPPVVLSLNGYVADCKNKDSVEGAVVRIWGSDGSVQEQKTGHKGQYHFSLNPDVSYAVTVFAEKAKSKFFESYYNLPGDEKAKFTTLGQNESKQFTLDFCLPPISITEPVYFPKVEYDLDKATLRPNSYDSLNVLYNLLIDNPTLVIELAAHTDSRGSEEHNLRLSQKRAESCYNYLVQEKKINPARIQPKGYGKRHLLVSDAEIAKMTTEELRELGHQTNRRTVIRVTKTDFSDPKAPVKERNLSAPTIKSKQEDYGDDAGTDAGN
jgi:peptidoglycan-associated lipoprotein